MEVAESDTENQIVVGTSPDVLVMSINLLSRQQVPPGHDTGVVIPVCVARTSPRAFRNCTDSVPSDRAIAAKRSMVTPERSPVNVAEYHVPMPGDATESLDPGVSHPIVPGPITSGPELLSPGKFGK